MQADASIKWTIGPLKDNLLEKEICHACLRYWRHGLGRLGRRQRPRQRWASCARPHLTRSDHGAEALAAAGAAVHRGSLTDLESLRSGAARSDAVIHTAFNRDYSKFAENSAEDQRAIEVIGAVLEGSDRPLLVTSGVARLAFGRMATEEDILTPHASSPRKSEEATAALVKRGIRASIIRLAMSVHGHGDRSGVAFLIALARQKGVSAYIGERRAQSLASRASPRRCAPLPARA